MMVVATLVVTAGLATLWFSPVATIQNNARTENSSYLAMAEGLKQTSYGEYIILNGSNQVMKIWVNYTETNVVGIEKLGNNVTLNATFGSSQVKVNGSTITLLMSINVIENNKSGWTASNTQKNNYANSYMTGVMAADAVGYVSSNLYTKYPSGYKAALDVTKVDVQSLSVYTITEVIADFGIYVGREITVIIESVPESAVAILGIAAVLAADYAYLYGYALFYNYPTIYFDVGASVGTQWYNFFDVGIYGEEGVFTGDYNSNNGLFIPTVVSAGLPYSLSPHSNVWNPFAEPPW